MSSTNLYTLLGSRDLDSAIICLSSLQRHAKDSFRLLILDDSTLSAGDISKLKDNLNIGEIILKKDRDQIINSKLKDYPACLNFRNTNVLSQKLFDCTLIGCGQVVNFIDSDIFFQRDFKGFPGSKILPGTSIFMSDIQSAYAISPFDLLLDNSLRICRSLNTGMFIFHKDSFNLDLLELFLSKYSGKNSFSTAACWAEQTCWAVLSGHTGCSVWDPEQLMIATPAIMDIENKTYMSEQAVGIHFVRSCRGLLNSYRDQLMIQNAEVQELKLVPAVSLGFLNLLSERMKAYIRH